MAEQLEGWLSASGDIGRELVGSCPVLPLKRERGQERPGVVAANQIVCFGLATFWPRNPEQGGGCAGFSGDFAK